MQPSNNQDIVQAIEALTRATSADQTTGLWSSFTPTFSGFNLGNGTLAARYTQIGKTVHMRIYVSLGSTSSVTGGINFSLPVTSSSAYSATQTIGTGTLAVAVGSGWQTGCVLWVGAGTAQLCSLNSATSFTTIAGTNATSPFTWANGSFWTVECCYEAA